MKNKKKYIFLAIFLFVVIYLTISVICRESSPNLIINYLHNINIFYILICLVILFLYFFLQGIYMKLILGSLNQKITLKKGMFYSLVEFYFSGITPSSTGGQPVQLYYMTKDKIPIRKSYITLILNTIYFKVIIFILGIMVLCFGFKYILSKSIIYILFFALGLLVDLGLIVISLLLLFKQGVIKKVLSFILKIAYKVKFLKVKVESININEVLERYNSELKYIKSHKKIIFFTFILTFIQRLLLFSIIFVIYKGLGFNYYNYFELLMIYVSVQMVLEAYPLPGGAILSEEMLNHAFIIHGTSLAATSMILTRTFSFYLPLLISGVIILVNSLLRKRIV